MPQSPRHAFLLVLTAPQPHSRGHQCFPTKDRVLIASRLVAKPDPNSHSRGSWSPQGPSVSRLACPGGRLRDAEVHARGLLGGVLGPTHREGLWEVQTPGGTVKASIDGTEGRGLGVARQSCPTYGKDAKPLYPHTHWPLPRGCPCLVKRCELGSGRPLWVKATAREDSGGSCMPPTLGSWGMSAPGPGWWRVNMAAPTVGEHPLGRRDWAHTQVQTLR